MKKSLGLLGAFLPMLDAFNSHRLPARYGAASSNGGAIVAVGGSHIYARKRRSKYQPHQGARERARRVAQMATHALTADNRSDDDSFVFGNRHPSLRAAVLGGAR